MSTYLKTFGVLLAGMVLAGLVSLGFTAYQAATTYMTTFKQMVVILNYNIQQGHIVLPPSTEAAPPSTKDAPKK